MRGNAVCTAEEVAAASGVKIGDRLISVDRKEAARGIFAALPYADTVRIRRSFPSTLLIELQESIPAAAVVSGGVAYVIDENGKLLSYQPAASLEEMLVVEGLTVSEAVPGKTIGVEDELRLDTLRQLLAAFSDDRLLENVDRVQAEKLYDIWFVYDGRMTVKIGDISDLERKLELMEEVIGRLDRSEKGTLDVSEVGTARYMAESIG
ncbi:MAG: FtsQ-type POTRA domain-containing protein [Clostridiales bacterium]|nr:FtsQ-type POTRA domain-containing protein [Clostridiales bacterium]